jgi:hypothetical protein
MAERKRFPEETWNSIVPIVSSAFSMDDSRSERLRANTTAKLIAAIPFLAGCREPERTALAHLGTYVIAGCESGEAVFDHKATDNYDVLARLATIASFEGGDPAIIARGMKLLASIIIRGYQRDIASDQAKGLYNPVGAGAWNADQELASLASAIASIEDAEMDAIVGGAVKGSWWMKA